MPDNIHFTTNPAGELKDFLSQKRYSKICVLTDENTHRQCYPVIQDGIPEHHAITVVPGEEAKTLTTCTHIWQAMTDHALDRHSVLIVLGGGVLGDMGGFCAATYKRGIDFILIPTTLLSQVDASIGGKLGVDFDHYKNHIGVFQSPALTLINSSFLKTLPPAELRSGFAEVIKHCLISDMKMWKEVSSRQWETQEWQKVTKHSVDFKLRVVSEDPRERGLRKILNAGHTIGHAVESHLLNKNQKVLHGEAVAAGLIMEAHIAMKRGMLSNADAGMINQYILKTFGKIALPEKDDDTIIQLMAQDKKNKGNKILCVLLEGIGKARWDCEISNDEVKGALSFYRGV
jgi:3-dehydroquinate synthase